MTPIFPRAQPLCRNAEVAQQELSGWLGILQAGDGCPPTPQQLELDGSITLSLRVSLLLTLLKHLLPQAKWFLLLGLLLLQDIYVSWQMVYCTTCFAVLFFFLTKVDQQAVVQSQAALA